MNFFGERGMLGVFGPKSTKSETLETKREPGYVEGIVAQLVTDFYSGTEDGRERSLLAIQELRSLGQDGMAAMKYLMKNSKDELGETIGKIIGMKDDAKVEKILGIERMPLITESPKSFDSEDFFRPFYERAQNTGMLDGLDVTSLPSFIDLCMSKCGVDKRHINKAVEEEIFAVSATFGVDEPSYLELLGPEEIVKIRELDAPRMLLLGSIGPYSAREFSQFSKKINPNSQPNVIDLEDYGVSSYQGENDLNFQVGNVLDMPFEDQSFDCLFTNFLIHALRSDQKSYYGPTVDDIKKLFEESYRVLKKGGSFTIVEEAYYQYVPGVKGLELAIMEILDISKRTGFKLEKRLPGSYAVPLRPEAIKPGDINSGARISQNGLPYYEKMLLTESPGDNFFMKFVKE